MSIQSEEQPYALSDRYLLEHGTVLLSGIQALARIPIDQLRLDRAAGLNTAAMVSGYPGSPLGGFDTEIARATRLVSEPIVLRPAVNEELGATTVMGSQLASTRPDATYDGVVGIWYGKAPGLDRAGDALRHGVFAGSSPGGGAVALVGDDPACKSSTMPSSSDASLVDLHMPVLYPGTVHECLELGLHAVALSRCTGLWSAMKIITPVADGSGTVTLPALTEPIITPTVEVDGETWKSAPTAMFLGAARMLKVEREFREIRLPLATEYGRQNRLNQIRGAKSDAWLGIVSTGYTYQQVLEALRRLGLSDEQAIADAGIRLLQLRMPVPFDEEIAREFARGLDEIVVVEEKNATLEVLIKDALYGTNDQPLVVGKRDDQGEELMRSWGLLDADAMVKGLRRRLSPRLSAKLVPEAPKRTRIPIPLSVNRTPFFCSGCPHNWGTKVPDGALVGAGTGCHGMTLLMDEERVGESIGITAMGNEGAQWVGMEPFVTSDHLFQNYGDGTYQHSAQLALQYCVGVGANITFKILYNGTVAMTGGQDSPAALGVSDLVTTLLAQGVKRVAVTTEDTDRYRSIKLPAGVQVYDRDKIVEVQEQLQTVKGVTVLIHDQYCAAELRRDRKRDNAPTPTKRVVINHRICEGCGDCGDVSNCLSVQPVETPLGRKTTIDQASCNFDYSCAKGDCPAFMIVESNGSAPAKPAMFPSPPETLPAPVVDAANTTVKLRLAGIGGTGVVTVAQILSTAAMLDGWEVRGLDQTGLSQKAGPVISDITLSRGDASASNLLGSGEADVLLGFDGMVAASDAALDATDSQRTVGVISTAEVPTGRMISDPTIPQPSTDVASRLEASTLPQQLHRLDAAGLSELLVGSPASANVLLLGVALQTGAVPVDPTAIDTAIELNGVAVVSNRAALAWGRAWATNPEAVESTAADQATLAPVDTVTVADVPKRLRARIDALLSDGANESLDLLQMLVGDLVAYQDVRYAGRFLDGVEKAVDAERLANGSVGPLTEAVARNLHRLMAYKDEYEVARLMLLPEAQAAAEEAGGAGADVTWMLHPPMLKSLGLSSKMGFSAKTSTQLFQTIAKGKRVRGSRLDPFGQSSMRKLEQALPGEYLDSMNQVYRRLTADRLDDAVAIAELPDQIRGYEDLKLRRVDEYREHMRQKLASFAR